MRILYPFIVALLLFSLPFFWFPDTVQILGGEAYTQYSFEQLFYNNLYTWNERYGFGVSNLYVGPQVYHALGLLLNIIFSTTFTTKILLGFLLSGGFVSMYLLISYLYKSRNIYIVISGMLYVLNPFYLMMFTWFPTYGFLFIFLPLTLLFYLKLQMENERKIEHMVFLFFSAIGLSVLSINPGLFSILFIIIGIHFLYQFFLKKVNIRKFLYACISIGIILLANIFWILPIAVSFNTLFGGAALYNDNIGPNSLFSYPLLNSLTLNEYYWFSQQNIAGDYYYPYSVYYQIPSQLIMLIILILLVVTTNFWHQKVKDKTNHQLLYFAWLLIIVGAFLTKGSAFPFGDVFSIPVSSIKALGIFRSSDIKFPYLVLLGYSLILPLSLINLRERIRSNRLYNAAVFVTIGLILFLGYPFLTGDVLPNSQKTIPSIKVSLPENWQRFASFYQDNDSYGRMLLFPKNSHPLDTYVWGYQGVFLPYNLQNKPIIGFTWGYGSTLEEKRFSAVDVIYSFYEQDNIRAFKNSLSLFGIDTILQRNDFDQTRNANDPSVNPDPKYTNEKISEFLSEEFKAVFKNNGITTYSITKEYSVQNLFIPERIHISNTTSWSDALQEALNDRNFQSRSTVFLQSEHLNQLQGWNKKIARPKVHVVKHDPTHYTVIIDQMSDTFPLVFNYSYSPNWLATIKQGNSFKGLGNTSGVRQILANGFANAWIINPQSMCDQLKCVQNSDGTFSVEMSLKYRPQSFFYLGLLLTLSFGIIVVFLLFLKKVKLII